MNKLLKINTTDSERITVSARDLHKALEVSTDFNHWFTRMCEYGFEAQKDFTTFLSESTGGRPSQDAQITVDMAKEIAMLQRTEKGKEVRKYFIQIEKEWNSPERVMARALTIANKTIATLEIENKEMKPKALFADAVASSKTSILIGQLAKRDAWLKDIEIVPYDGPDFNRQYIEALERVEKIKNLDWSAENEDGQPA